MDILIIVLGLCFCCICNAYSNGSLPEQVHISFGDGHDSMVVMWSSRDAVHYNVTYWTARDNFINYAGSDVIRFPKEAANAAPFAHRSVLKNLMEDTQYFYQITPRLPNNDTLQYESEIFSFSTLDKSKKTPYKFLVYGDLGFNRKIPTYAELERLVDSGEYTAILHVGDMAYNLNSDLGRVGDKFFNNIQPFASRVPYMPTPGNHEIFDDFIHYRIRFSSPNTPWPIPVDQMWYSYNVGPVHFISYSTEVFFTYNEYYVCKQFDWLLQDLIRANKNRDQQPWIIALGHRPIYCSNNNGDDCANRLFRRWVEYGLEDLFYAQGVDMIIQAHEHSYERLWPVYKRKVYSRDYVDPRAPVHIISGAAGGPEGIDWMQEGKRHAWSAFKADKTSRFTFGQLEIHNATHLYFEQRESTANESLDSFWLVQNNHGPFVADLNCEGKKKHPSCFCPPPILYIYYLVGAGTGVIVLLVIVIIVYRYMCRKRSCCTNTCKRNSKYSELHEESECEKLFNDYNESCERTQRNPNDGPTQTANHVTEEKSRVHESIKMHCSATDSDDTALL